jgi:lactoylglutathione lyase
MKLDHINLTVGNVVQAGTFLKKHFGYQDMFEDNNAGMAALDNGSGTHILLMKGAHVSYPKYFHVGFDPGDEAGVNASYDRLKADGIELEHPEHTPWGSYTFNFKCSGGDFIIEVACASQG